MSRLRIREWVIAVAVFLLPQVVSIALGPILFPTKDGQWRRAAWLFAGSLLLYLLVFLWERRPPGRALQKLIKSLLEGSVWAPKADRSTESMWLCGSGADRARWVATEYVAESAGRAVVCFFPADDEEKEEIFSRIARGYWSALRDLRAIGIGLRPRIPLRLFALPGASIFEIVQSKIASMFDEPRDSLAVVSLCRMLAQGRRPALPLIDATAMSGEQLVDWLRGSGVPRKRLDKVVVAARPDTEATLASACSPICALADVSRHSPGRRRVVEVQREVDMRAQSLCGQRGTSRTECDALLRSTAVASLRLQLKRPETASYFLQDYLLYDGRFADAVDYIPDWIEAEVSQAGCRYGWRMEARLVRDFLVARSIYQHEQSDSDAFLWDSNQSPVCAYVRPFVEYFSRSDQLPDHVLSRYGLTVAHRFILEAWKGERSVDRRFVHEAFKGKQELISARLDWRDLNQLLPGFVGTSSASEFAELFRAVPPLERGQSILDSHAAGRDMVSAVANLLSETDLWLFFEGGGCPTDDAVRRMKDWPDRQTLTKMAMLMVLAPHAAPLPGILVPVLAFAVESCRDTWSWADTLPLSQADVELICQRVAAVALLLGRTGRLWIDGIKKPGTNCAMLLELRHRVTGILGWQS